MNFSEIGLKDLVLDFDSNDLQDITIVQGDTKTRGFKVLVSTNNGEIIKASSQYEMRLYGINSNYPDKSFFTKGVIDGDFYKVYISTDMASKSGKLQLQLALFEGTNALIQSRIKEVDVYRSIANGGNVGMDLVVDFGKLNKVVEIAEKQQKKFEESLVRQQAVESKISQKHTEVVQIRDGLKDVLTTENERVEAEKKRVSAESTRASQEKLRQANEQLRKDEETKRINAENTRLSQESTRKSEEQKRITAESSRNSAETKRDNAEKIRIENENKRRNTFDTWDKTMKKVIKGADGSNFTWNMLKKSNVKVENSDYLMAKYDLAEKPVVSETYTCTVWGNLSEGKNIFTIYNSDKSVFLGNLIKIKDGMYQSTFKWINYKSLFDGAPPEEDDTQLFLYAVYENIIGATSRIDKIKLEKGTNTNPVWSPAISDITDLQTTLDKKVSSGTVKNIAIIEKGASTTNIPANTLIFEKE